jgi:hypothetical protein
MTTAEAALPSQLEMCASQFRHACEDARTLLTYYEPELLSRRPVAARWSPIECVAHLNLANQAMLPGIQNAVDAAAPSDRPGQPYRLDFVGRLLAWTLEPPPLLKLKAPTIAEPVQTGDPEHVLSEFEQLHAQLLDLLHKSAGRAIDLQKMKSPFANVQYNGYAAFRIVSAHDRRHLWQARKMLAR